MPLRYQNQEQRDLQNEINCYRPGLQPPRTSYPPNAQLTSEPLSRQRRKGKGITQQRTHMHGYWSTKCFLTWGHRLTKSIAITRVSLPSPLREGSRAGGEKFVPTTAVNSAFLIDSSVWMTDAAEINTWSEKCKISTYIPWDMLSPESTNNLFKVFYLDKSTISQQAPILLIISIPQLNQNLV